jgi:hypothetical protein
MPADVTTCPRCRGAAAIVWYNAVTGRHEDWPCILCEWEAFDAREAAEGLTPKASEEPRR